MPKRIYQFKITLKGITPPIWRRIQVPETYSFSDLHVAIQDAMGWLDYHLHLFQIHRKHVPVPIQIGIPDDYAIEGDPEIHAGWEESTIHRSLLPGKSNLMTRQNGGSGHFHKTRINYLVREC